jgi:hypothetical protein
MPVITPGRRAGPNAATVPIQFVSPYAAYAHYAAVPLLWVRARPAAELAAAWAPFSGTTGSTWPG